MRCHKAFIGLSRVRLYKNSPRISGIPTQKSELRVCEGCRGWFQEMREWRNLCGSGGRATIVGSRPLAFRDDLPLPQQLLDVFYSFMTVNAQPRADVFD